MTVTATTETRKQYTGNASYTTSTDFTAAFKYLSTSEIKVTHTNTTTGTDTAYTEGTHYSVQSGASATSVTIRFLTSYVPTAATEYVTIFRETTFDQLTDYTEGSTLDAETLEQNFDKGIMLIQQVNNNLTDLNISFSGTNDFNTTAAAASEISTSKANRTNKVLAFDSNGDIQATQEIGTNRGDWSTGATYQLRDLAKQASASDASTQNNIYICTTAHTSTGSYLTQNDTANWSLILEVAGAAASATTATTKAAEAATSATSAASSATTATTQATTATTQATTATTKASEASTSASNAASSATSAASSAANAAASYDSFDDRYLGIMADSASGSGNGINGTFNGSIDGPGDDNDGNALVTGALYYNTTDGEMRVYSGSAWIAASAAQNATVLDYTYTLSGSDATISGADDNSATLSFSSQESVDVFLNGVKLVPKIGATANDYHLDTSNTVTLTSTAVSGDVILVRVYKTFSVGDAVPASTGGTFSGNVVFSGNTTGLDVNGTELVLDADGDTSITADTDDRIDIKVGGTDRVHIASSGHLGIGTNNPLSPLSVVDPTSNTGLEIYPENATDTNKIINFDRVEGAYKKLRVDASEQDFWISGLSRFKIDSSGNANVSNGNLVIGTAGKGIDFSSTGNPTRGIVDASILNDYEYGAGGSTTSSNTSQFFQGSTNISYDSGFQYYASKYIRIGDQVTVFFGLDNYINPTSNQDLGTGHLGVYLPYNVATYVAQEEPPHYASFFYYRDNLTYGKGFAMCETNQTYAKLYKDSFSGSNFNGNGTNRLYFHGSITYIAA